MSTVIFDPYTGYEHICKVELLLGGIGCLMSEGSCCQFGEFDEYDNLFIYSPKLKAPDLNEFCGKYMKEYERIAIEHRLAIQNGTPFKMVYFWE